MKRTWSTHIAVFNYAQKRWTFSKIPSGVNRSWSKCSFLYQKKRDSLFFIKVLSGKLPASVNAKQTSKQTLSPSAFKLRFPIATARWKEKRKQRVQAKKIRNQLDGERKFNNGLPTLRRPRADRTLVGHSVDGLCADRRGRRTRWWRQTVAVDDAGCGGDARWWACVYSQPLTGDIRRC